ncbi:unnamed protein product [Adineta steineri]|uniref:Uncharacterized protein n=1 Tax=Adineta steineri TaxID=433720 RepID=A0A816CV52_9BILA|nr:unnamed protein product [Adineta steineri]CAF1630074.1 unnamed protein product [Adineta steineri]
MQLTVLFLLMATVIGAAQSQSWAGTYTVDSSCNTTSCCCLSGKAVLTSTTNGYSVNSSASSLCNSNSTFTGTLSTTNYTGWIKVNSDNDTVTLSSDSLTITINDTTNSTCTNKLIKSGALAQHANIIRLLALFLFGMMINVLAK